jgi:hypothetical protein
MLCLLHIPSHAMPLSVTLLLSYYIDINLSYFLFPINSIRCLSYLLLGLALGSNSLVELKGHGLASDVGLLSESRHARLCMANWDSLACSPCFRVRASWGRLRSLI